jgi:hypothetical protein
MRVFLGIAVVSLLAPLALAADKLGFEDRVELTRGLTAEYANARVMLPRSKKDLEFDAVSGTYDKAAWSQAGTGSGPAARVGDTVQITKISLENDRIVLQINGGYGGGAHWYDRIQTGGVGGAAPVPIHSGANSNAPGGTSIAILFHKALEPIRTAEIKKMLAPILDFDRHSATEIYYETLPPETQKAIKEKRAAVGMNHEQVRMAMGQPVYKERETKDGVELEDWIYGHAPGKITFVTFEGDKAIKVKEEYAGLGVQVDPTRK